MAWSRSWFELVQARKPLAGTDLGEGAKALPLVSDGHDFVLWRTVFLITEYVSCVGLQQARIGWGCLTSLLNHNQHASRRLEEIFLVESLVNPLKSPDSKK